MAVYVDRSKRALAVKAGAIEVDDKAAVAIWKKQMEDAKNTPA